MGNGLCFDQATGLMWQIERGKRFSDINEMKKYLAGLQLGGFTNWYLPATRQASALRGLIAIRGNEDCKFPQLKSKYWLIDEKKDVIPALLELECFCRGDYNPSSGVSPFKEKNHKSWQNI